MDHSYKSTLYFGVFISCLCVCSGFASLLGSLSLSSHLLHLFTADRQFFLGLYRIALTVCTRHTLDHGDRSQDGDRQDREAGDVRDHLDAVDAGEGDHDPCGQTHDDAPDDLQECRRFALLRLEAGGGHDRGSRCHGVSHRDEGDDQDHEEDDQDDRAERQALEEFIGGSFVASFTHDGPDVQLAVDLLVDRSAAEDAHPEQAEHRRCDEVGQQEFTDRSAIGQAGEEDTDDRREGQEVRPVEHIPPLREHVDGELSAVHGRACDTCVRGHVEEVVFEKDTIVLDNCLTLPGNNNRKRFTIGHEAGHVIKSRLYGTNESRFYHAGGVLIETRDEMDERFSISEVEANNIAANLLMPESTIKLLMEVLYKSEKLIQYDECFLDRVDSSKVSVLASIMGVSFTAMFYRLKSLGFVERGVLATFVEENVMREVEP